MLYEVITYPESGFIPRLRSQGRNTHVITSYSIHYTKLYEAPENEPKIEQKTPENSHLKIEHECHAANRQNVGNMSDYTIDRLDINTPPLPHHSESVTNQDDQVPATWAKIRESIISSYNFV